MAARYMTPEDEATRRLRSLQCRACNRIFLYSRAKDRQVNESEGRAFVVCPCGKEFTLGLGGVESAAESAAESALGSD